MQGFLARPADDVKTKGRYKTRPGPIPSAPPHPTRRIRSRAEDAHPARNRSLTHSWILDFTCARARRGGETAADGGAAAPARAAATCCTRLRVIA